MTDEVTFRVFRGEPDEDGDPFGEMVDYTVEMDEGMVVFVVIHKIQAEQAPDPACPWNSTPEQSGSCSAELDGMPRLISMTRMDDTREETSEADGG